MRRRVWAAGLLGLGLHGCAAGIGPWRGEPATTWLPLADGVRWIYEVQREWHVSTGDRETDGGSTRAVAVEGVDRISGHDPLFRWMQHLDQVLIGRVLEARDAGLLDVGTYHPRWPLPRDPLELHDAPLPVLRSGLRVGKRWKSLERLPESLQRVTAEAEVLGLERVATPAGAFEDCLSVRVRHAGPGPASQEMRGFVALQVEYERVDWYARGVGRVRSLENLVLRGRDPQGEPTSRRLKRDALLVDRIAGPRARVLGAPVRAAVDLDSVLREELAALLRGGRYADLDARLAALQVEYETGARSSSSLANLYELVVDQDLAGLDAWVADRSGSPLAHLARGHHFFRLGWKRRGGGFWKQLSEENKRGMRDAFERAEADLRLALHGNARLPVAWRDLHSMGKAAGGRRDGCAEPFAHLLELESDPLDAYRMEASCLDPRWGGSLEDLTALVENAQTYGEAVARPLAADVAATLAEAARNDGDAADGLWRQAAELDPRYRTARARHHVQRGRHRAALDDLDALVRGGMTSSLLQQRAQVYRALGYAELALADLEDALRLDPDAKALHESALQVAADLRRTERAQQAADRLVEVAPRDADAWTRRALFETQHLEDHAGAAESFRRAIEIDPANRSLRMQWVQELWAVKDPQLPRILEQELAGLAETGGDPGPESFLRGILEQVRSAAPVSSAPR